jgi:hypothetical protein
MIRNIRPRGAHWTSLFVKLRCQLKIIAKLCDKDGLMVNKNVLDMRNLNDGRNA